MSVQGPSVNWTTVRNLETGEESTHSRSQAKRMLKTGLYVQVQGKLMGRKHVEDGPFARLQAAQRRVDLAEAKVVKAKSVLVTWMSAGVVLAIAALVLVFGGLGR